MKRNAFFLIILMLLLSISAWATVYSSGTINLAIPDNTPAGVNSTITVGDAGDVTNVKVGLNLTHTYDGDLVITLTHGATTVNLFNRYGGSGENMTGTIFDDAATTPIASGVAPYTGSFIPYQALSAFNGLNNSTGAWVLNVSDNAGVDVGVLIDWYVDLTIANPIPMAYTSSTTTQNSSIVYAGDLSAQVIGVQVVTTGSLPPFQNMYQFTLNTTGTTSVSDITNAKIFYTGTSSTFAATTQFGSTVASPSGTYTISGVQALSPGTNYFWLTYDIPVAAVLNNLVDAECTQIKVGTVLPGTGYVPTITAPTGTRQIKVPLAGVKTVGVGMTYTTLTAAINDLNSLGIGTGGVTFSLTSGAIFTEELPAITASGAADKPILFTKSASARAIIKPTGTAGTGDAGVAINGGDYITFDGIDITIATGQAVEYGFSLYGTATNGAQYNTIKNTTITLNKANFASQAIHMSSSATTAAGANSYNKFYNFTASNVYSGVVINGSVTPGAEDTGNEVGTTTGTNSISSIGHSTLGSSSVYGVYAYNQVNGKIFNTSVVTPSSTTGSIYGVYVAGAASTMDVYSNSLSIFTSNGASIYGIYITSGTTCNIYKNKINSIAYTGTGAQAAHGIFLAGGTTNNVYNNMIWDIKGVSSTATPGITGINVSAGTTNNIYYNSVLLNETATGLNISSAALYATTSSTTIDLRNNIFVNNSAIGTGGTGKAVAFWRSAVGYTNIAAVSNNNCYYAGTPDAQHLIHYDGTNSDQTLVAYKARIATKDQSAITENVPFRTPATSYQLHIATTTATQVESGGVPITTPISIIGDFDGDTGINIRSATYPDIGADEGTFVALDLNPPAISYTALAITSSLVSRTLAGVAITDGTGVNVTAGTKPRIYFKKSTDANVFGVANNSTGNGWKWTETVQGASPFDFTLNYSLLQSAPVDSDIIQYFVVAQDLATTPNVGAQPGVGFAGTSVSAITSAPTTPNSYGFIAAISGIKTIGTGGNYATITSALAALNTGELVGAVEYRLLNTDYSTSETFPLTINAVIGMSATNTVTFKPAIGVTGVVIGSLSATSIWNLNGATYVTIDGSNNGTSSKDLSLGNGSTTAPVINLTGASASNTIKNCLIGGQNASASSGLIYIGTTATGNGNSILNCDLGVVGTPPAVGIYIGGTFTGNQTIQGCYIEGMTSYGIYQSNSASNGVLIQQNALRNFGLYGIYLLTGNGTIINKCELYSAYPTSSTIGGIYLGNIPGAVVKKCKIHDISGSATASIVGIYIWGASGISLNHQIYNNEIYLETGVASTTGIVRGIDYYAFSANSCEIYYNSVYIGGSSNTGSSASYAFYKHDAATTFKVQNNVFVNARSNSTGTGKHYAIAITNITATTLVIDRNDYYVSGTGGVLGVYSSTDAATIAAWRTATGQDVNSISANPSYSFGAAYLRPYTSSPVFNAGTPITGITDDILDGLRNGVTPAMGAYETGVAGGLLTAPTNLIIKLDGDNVEIDWDPVPFATGYRIYWTLTPYAPSWTLLASPTTESYIDTTAPANQLRFYAVTATQ